MGIQIIFRPTRVAIFNELVIDKLKACVEAIKFFHRGLFFLKEVEVWFNAPSEALGGSLAKVAKSENPIEAANTLYEYFKELPYADIRKTIVIFRGNWEIDSLKIAGYFSIQNDSEWQSVYGDIEISAYAKGQIEDVVDILWSTSDAQGLLRNFVESIERGIKGFCIALSQITFSYGIPTSEDPSNLMAIYLIGERRALLRVFYRALRDSEDPIVVAKARPLDTRFLMDILAKARIVETRISERLEKAMVVEVPRKSALYIAKDRSSFKKLYEEISEAILKPALKNLPEESIVRERIERGLDEYHEPK